MKAIIPRTAAYLEVRSGCPPNERNMKYPTYIKNKISVVVSRGSQVHHVPQIGLAQIGPVINTSVTNNVPISAAARPSRSHFCSLLIKYNIPATITMK